MPPQYSIEARSLSIVGGAAGHERIDAVVFNNDRSALIAVQGALQDPGSRTAMLPIAQSQDRTCRWRRPRNRSNRAPSASRPSNRRRHTTKVWRGLPRAPHRAHRRSPGCRRGPHRSDPVQARPRRPRRGAL